MDKKEDKVELEVNDDRVVAEKSRVTWKMRWKQLLIYGQTDAMKKTYRSIVAFGISILFTLVGPLQESFGSLNILTPVTILLVFSDVSTNLNSIGGFVQTIVRFVVSIAISCGLVLVFLEIAFQSDSPGILLVIFMFISTFMFSYFRAKYPKWIAPMLTAKLAVVIGTLVASRNVETMEHSVLEVFLTLLVGTGISVVVNFAVFPQSACWSLKREMVFALNNTAELLHLTTKAFLLEASPEDLKRMDDLRAITNVNFARLTAYLDDTKVELNYGMLTTRDYVTFTNMTKVLLQHVWSMTSCNQSKSKLNDKAEIATKLLFPLKESVEKLSNMAAKDIREIGKFVEGTTTLSSSMDTELEATLKEFDDQQRKLIQTIMPRGDHSGLFHQLYFMYFWIFSFRELLNNLDNFIQSVQSVNPEKKIHFPIRLWEKPKKSVTTAQKYKHPLIETGLHEAWRYASLLDSAESRFAFKTALAVSLAAMFQYIPATSEVFIDWRGEWGVVTIPVTIAPSFGGNYLNGIYRVLGTIAGAIWGVIVWEIFPTGDPYGLWFFVMIFIIPCLWIIPNTPYARMGVITGVNMTVIVLGKYNNYTLHLLPDEAYQLAYKRAIMIIAAVIIVFAFSRLLFPFLARKELRKGMSVTVNMIGVYFSKLISTLVKDKMDIELIREFEKMEAKIQLRIVKHTELLGLAASEPRMKGKFMAAEVGICLKCCQFILDRLRSMRLSLKGFGKDVRRDIIKPLNVYRKDMIADVLMLFYIIGGALHSKAPLPHYLPRAQKSRDRVLIELEKLDAIRNGEFHKSNQYVPFYAYGMAISDMIDQLETFADTLKAVFGEVDYISSMFDEQHEVRTSDVDLMTDSISIVKPPVLD